MRKLKKIKKCTKSVSVGIAAERCEMSRAAAETQRLKASPKLKAVLAAEYALLRWF